METIVFFALTPEIGHGKTRLRTALSEEQIFHITRKLYDDLLETLTDTGYRVVVYYDGKEPSFSLPCVPQKEVDLGERMASSIRTEIQKGPVLLMGCDLLGVDGDLIEEGFRLLKDRDVVFAPAEDGGYGIVGMRRFVDVFSSITYSRPDVLEKTVEKAKTAGATVALLPTIRDIDYFEDLVREALNSPVVSKEEDVFGTVYTSEEDSRLWILKDKNRVPEHSLYCEPKIMLPFYHSIQAKEVK